MLLTMYSKSLMLSYCSFSIIFSARPLQSCSSKNRASSLGISITFKPLLFIVSPVIFKCSSTNSTFTMIRCPLITLFLCIFIPSILLIATRSLTCPDLLRLSLQLVRQNSQCAILFITLLLSFQSLFSFSRSKVGFLFCNLERNFLFSSVTSSSCFFLKIQFRLRCCLNLPSLLGFEQLLFLPITLSIFINNSLFSRSISIFLISLICSCLLRLITTLSAWAINRAVIGFISLMFNS